MKIKYVFNFIMNLVLSSLALLTVLAITEQILFNDLPWFSYIKFCLPALICFIIGFLCRTKPAAFLVCLFASAAAAALIPAVLLSKNQSADTVFIILTALSGLFLFQRGSKADQGFPPVISLCSNILYLFAIFLSHTFERGFDYTFGTIAIINFALTLISFNSESLQNGLHNIKGGRVMQIPRGLWLKNLVLLTVFVTLALALSAIGPLRNAAGNIVYAVGYGIWYILGSIDRLISSGRVDVPPDPTPELTPEPQEAVPLPQPEGGVNPIVIILFVSVGILFLLGVLLSYATSRDGSEGFFAAFKKRFGKGEKAAHDLEYEEESEKLISLGELFGKRRKGAKKMLTKLFTKHESIHDMPNNAMKIRFAYKTLLKNAGAPKSGLPVTPLEHSQQLSDEYLKRLASDYSTVKYAETSQAPEDAAQNAELAVKALGKHRM